MSISSITSAARVAAASAESAAAKSRQATPVPVPAEQLDEFTQQPLPPRFPWLSRLALQLEAASRQRSAFAPAPALGDHIDQSA